MLLKRFCFLLMLMLACSGAGSITAADEMVLRSNLKQAHEGDYLVSAQGKTYTILHIYKNTDSFLLIEEITVPISKIPKIGCSWKSWVASGAPGQTCWVIYVVELPSGAINHYFSVNKDSWFRLSESENFLSTLLSLHLSKIPLEERRRVGPPPPDALSDTRPVWQPRMTVEGILIPGVLFDAWKTKWPNDSSPLAGKTIEVFIPQEHQTYSSYFPYWLQVRGTFGKAELRIVDSGTGLASPININY